MNIHYTKIESVFKKKFKCRKGYIELNIIYDGLVKI